MNVDSGVPIQSALPYPVVNPTAEVEVDHINVDSGVAVSSALPHPVVNPVFSTNESVNNQHFFFLAARRPYQEPLMRHDLGRMDVKL